MYFDKYFMNFLVKKGGSQNNMYILTVDEKQHTFIEGMLTLCYIV